VAWLGALAADASEHGGRTFIMAPILEVKQRKGNSPISVSLKRYSHKTQLTEIFWLVQSEFFGFYPFVYVCASRFVAVFKN
jgi:hypothetical protein